MTGPAGRAWGIPAGRRPPLHFLAPAGGPGGLAAAAEASLPAGTFLSLNVSPRFLADPGVVAALGALSIAETPAVLGALDPRNALGFAVHAPGLTCLVLGAVFLAITGAEALYADMGHFGRAPIRLAWFGLVFPALMVNYFGQGALALRSPAALKNPFYLLAPDALLAPMVVLAAAATVIASQATISGAFSVTQQAARLGYLPRVTTGHTSEAERGQIDVPPVNWTMLVLVVLVVLGFGSSGAIASAYGIAVSGTMVLTTALIAIVTLSRRKRANPLFLALLGLIGAAELVFFGANATKFADGGWFPIACALALFVVLTTWKRGGTVIAAHLAAKRVPLERFAEVCGADVPRVPGTAIYLSADPEAVPTVMLHNLKHNKVLHEHVIFLTVLTEEVPVVPAGRRVQDVQDLGNGFYWVTARYGFMQDPSVPDILERVSAFELEVRLEATTFFLGRETLLATERPGMARWREALFSFMSRNALRATAFFKIPPDQVFEVGVQVEM